MASLHLSSFERAYVAAWIGCCLVATLILIFDRKRWVDEWHRYFKFLAAPWKLGTFAIAFLFVTFAGRFTDDETWDVVTGSGMSILTFLFAPWSIGVAYQACTGRKPLRYLLVALVLMLFASSWFYDGYLLLRDKAYTVRWLGNLMLSPFIFIAAGLLWNLEAKAPGEHRVSQFAFVKPDWPSPPENSDFGPLVLASIPFISIAIFVLIFFVGWRIF